MEIYEVLNVERDLDGNGTYYIRYYPDIGLESKGINMKLSEWDFDLFIENKREV